MRSCNQCYKFETHTDMEVASASDLAAASAQGTILLIEYDGAWYGNGTVGDVRPPSLSNATNGTTDSSSDQSEFYESESSYGNSVDTSYAAAYATVGGAVLVFLGVALGRFRKATRRRVVLAAGEGTPPSTTSLPLV